MCQPNDVVPDCSRESRAMLERRKEPVKVEPPAVKTLCCQRARHAGQRHFHQQGKHSVPCCASRSPSPVRSGPAASLLLARGGNDSDPSSRVHVFQVPARVRDACFRDGRVGCLWAGVILHDGCLPILGKNLRCKCGDHNSHHPNAGEVAIPGLARISLCHCVLCRLCTGSAKFPCQAAATSAAGLEHASRTSIWSFEFDESAPRWI
jgi:hypothetical protein